MDASDLTPMVDDLRDSVDDLEIALAPLLRQNHAEITSKLPLLDKAKVSVLTTYAIESILFSVLKLNGVNAKEHPIFTELTRVKQYFEKIKEAEDGGPEKRKNMKLNAPAANRFIKHALAGNDKYDKKRAEQQMQEQQRAKRKLDEIEGPNETTSEPTSIHQKTVTDLSASSSQPNTRGATADPEEISSSTKSTAPALPEQDAARKERKRARREQRKEEGNHKNHSKKKSSKPPKDSKTVFQSLLKRGAEG